jgi:hypothetical protein
MPDPKTEELRIAEMAREAEERTQARQAEMDDDEQAHERRADKHAYLRDKLAERARAEDEADG